VHVFDPPLKLAETGVFELNGQSDGSRHLLEHVLAWVTSLDYGTVPAWAGAASLLLAYRIFQRDRLARERAQVDLVGFWLTVEHERRSPADPRVEAGTFTRYVRNGSALPIQIMYMAFEIHTRWMVRDLAQWRDELPIWTPTPGTDVVRMYGGKVRVAPEDTWSDSSPQEVNVGHLAPEHADQLDFIEGLSYRIRWVLLIDNAGRRWEVRPEMGGPARRIRWWSRRRRDYPVEWKNPVTFGLAVRMHLFWDWVRAATLRLVRAVRRR